MKRENLLCLFVLVDPRHKPQKSDIEFMEFLGMSQIPFARVFTKSDKMSRDSLARSVREYNAIMLDELGNTSGDFHYFNCNKGRQNGHSGLH